MHQLLTHVIKFNDIETLKDKKKIIHFYINITF